jgi:hypothetical protein
MRGLLRSALALLALGLGAIGCNRAANSEGGSGEGVEAPYHASFRVPGMS